MIHGFRTLSASRPTHGALAVLLSAALVLPAAATAQSTAEWVPPPARGQSFELSIRNIMAGYENVGRAPSSVRFSEDGEWIYFRWLPGGNDWDEDPDLYRVPAEGGEPERIDDVEAAELEPLLAGGDVSDDGVREVVSSDGDLFLVNRNDLSVRQLTETREGESSPMFSRSGDRIFYRSGMNLFAMQLDGTAITQLTDIRSGSEPGEEEPTDQQAFLEEQQTELFEWIRRRQMREAEQDSLQELLEADDPEPVYIPNGERLGGLTPSPDASRVLLTTVRPGSGREVEVPFWVTESGYTESREIRTKVGDEQSTGRVGHLVTATGEVTWLEPKPSDFDGEVRARPVEWNDAGTRALIMSESEDNKNWWLYAFDAASGELALLDHLYDEAWVGGPCGFGCRGWLPGTDRVWYVSEETGYAQLYAVNADGTGKERLTNGGEWEVLDVSIPEVPGDRFLLSTNEDSPFNEHVGWLDLDGGEVDYLTDGDGRFEVTLSRDGERAAVVHDVANRPPELFVAEGDDVGDMEQVTVTPTAGWLTFPWIQPEIVRFQAEDGTMVPARIYRPSDVGAEPNGAAVLFVHGAGYLHNVHNYWSNYFREYQFNHFLAASGYTVLDIDYRGSAGYGRDWRTAIYRWMGGKDLSDQVDGARWLVEQEGIDPDRIGLYGGSYGGFITLMGLFTAGDTFKSGAALRSVTDWAHYNHGYTSNILNMPQADEEAYRQSSPIYFAENFGPDQHLLIPHGMVDVNVHFSDVVRLAQRLIELGKENWEMAVYPVEDHGFVTPSSWTDEYRRIFELFERTLSEPGCTEGGELCAVPVAQGG